VHEHDALDLAGEDRRELGELAPAGEEGLVVGAVDLRL
jgi:hypothetical protein